MKKYTPEDVEAAEAQICNGRPSTLIPKIDNLLSQFPNHRFRAAAIGRLIYEDDYDQDNRKRIVSALHYMALKGWVRRPKPGLFQWKSGRRK